MLLSECTNGQIAQITHLKGEVEMKMRLVNLGFHTHSVVELIMIRGNNLVITVDGSRFALDKQIAELVEVEPLS
ncbi:FeoA family protein [Thiomicrorhabdus xiamenensis]|uniref:Ferrous iron transport protein A n=1 Tax=Thiomicrorhabdus xiamenensis TaxID=2739063 RepID=A0A7D4NQ07_9GAMM|nr:FeoA family protein [Thiomicrorhabdus xiamenensis]QKI88497.1 ferrous iron transport protein A [Thiomicrorhabdus xiamenensis]